MRNLFLRSCLVLSLLFTSAPSHVCAASPVPGTTRFSLANGSGTGQVLWLLDRGQVSVGPNTGPAAFAVDEKSALWVADTLNCRILQFLPSGKPGKHLDLKSIQSKANLPFPPAVVDLALVGNDRLYAADEANHQVLVLKRDGTFVKSLGKPGKGPGEFLQINRLYADRQGTAFVEDVPLAKIVGYPENGAAPVEFSGLGGVAVTPSGKVLQPLYQGLPKERTLELYSPTGEKLYDVGKITESGDIKFIMPLGLNARDEFVVTYLGETQQVFLGIAATDGHKVWEKRTPILDSGFSTTTPYWLGLNGKVYFLEAQPARLLVKELE